MKRVSPLRGATSRAKSEKDRKEEDVVIFNYSLSRTDGNPPFEVRGPSSGSFIKGDNIFFQVLKDRHIEWDKFNRVISPTKEPRLIRSRHG